MTQHFWLKKKKIIFIITTANVQALWDWSCQSQQLLVLHLICNCKRIMFTTFIEKEERKKTAFPRTFLATGVSGKVFVLVLILTVFFSFFCLSFMGRPAVLISDIHVSRAPWSFGSSGVLKNFHILFWFAPKFSRRRKSLTAAGLFKANICIVFSYVVLQPRGRSGPSGVPPLSSKGLTNAEKWCEGINTVGIAHQRVEKQIVI